MAMVHELAGGKNSGDEFGTVNQRIQARFQKADQILAGVALDAYGFGINAAKLLLGNIP